MSITFTEFAQKLAFGQLKNTAAKDTTLGVIKPDYMDTLLELTNQGLIDLTTRLSIITRLIDLTFVTGLNIYPLTDAALTTYLDISETDTFVGEEFVKVLSVIDSLGKNHPHDTNGHIMTPTYNTLRFTADIMEDLGTKVRIRYQAKHPIITLRGSIDLPPNLITGLQLFVASLYMSHMNGEEHSAKGDSYFGAYLRHIGEDETRNTSSVSEIHEDTRFQDRGFV